jgi:hypothetical protein
MDIRIDCSRALDLSGQVSTTGTRKGAGILAALAGAGLILTIGACMAIILEVTK